MATRLTPVLSDNDKFLLAVPGDDERRAAYAHTLLTDTLSSPKPLLEWLRWADWHEADVAAYRVACHKAHVQPRLWLQEPAASKAFITFDDLVPKRHSAELEGSDDIFDDAAWVQAMQDRKP